MWSPRSAWALLGDGRPRWRPRPRRWRGGRGLGRGRPSSPRSRLRVELARGALARHAGLCPAGKAARVKIGGVHHASSGVLRGVLPRSLGRLRRLRPAGFGWGRARLINSDEWIMGFGAVCYGNASVPQFVTIYGYCADRRVTYVANSSQLENRWVPNVYVPSVLRKFAALITGSFISGNCALPPAFVFCSCIRHMCPVELLPSLPLLLASPLPL